MKRGDLVAVIFNGYEPDEVAIYIEHDESFLTNDPAYMRAWVFWAGRRTSFPVHQLKIISEIKNG